MKSPGIPSSCMGRRRRASGNSCLDIEKAGVDCHRCLGITFAESQICQKSNPFLSAKTRSRAQRTAIEYFIALLPELYYGINRVLEDCPPRFSKNVGVALWALEVSKQEDRLGRYLTTSQLVSKFRDWFVVSDGSTSSQISKV